MKGFIVDHQVVESDAGTVLALYGRLENGESFALQQKVQPYLFIREADLKKTEKVLKRYHVDKTACKNAAGEAVVQITAPSAAELEKLLQFLQGQEIETYEADLKPYMRFCIDNNILACIDIQGGFEKGDRVDRIYGEAIIKPAECKPKLKVLSLDIETDKNADDLYCIGLYSEGYKKVLLVSNKKVEGAESFPTEEACLEAFVQAVKELDPDIITGWNLIDFDLKYLNQKFKTLGIIADLGRVPGNLKVRISANYMRDSSADIIGRQILDAMALVGDPFIQEAPTIRNANFASMSLEDVSQEILKKGKLVSGENRHKVLDEYYKEDQKKLVEYNIMDCQLAYDILEKADLISLAMQRSQLTALPLDRITASIAAFDSLYIREARKNNLVSPTNTFKRREERIKGGYVMDSKSGIYHEVLVLDFKSLYPSIITTFNIDPLSFLVKKEKDVVEAPNGALFRNNEGILPKIIKKLHIEREKAKSEKKELSSYALKIIMNSFFGVLASPNCRYFNLDMANAITSFGRQIIQLTAKKIEEQGAKVIYSDTDSVFITTDLKGKKADIVGRQIQDEINDFYKEHIKEKYKRQSYLELQFSKHYKAFMIPSIRQTKIAKEDRDPEKKTPEAAGAKKRYAGLLVKDGKEELEIVGLEAIRGDWTDAAGDFQRELLLKVFNKEKVESFIADYIKKIRAGKMDSKLIYRKSIRKALNQYTKTTPPHVKAARQLDSLESNVIQYYITEAGPEPIQKIKHKIDYDHYINKQIKPIAEQVLALIGLSFEDVAASTKQTKLF